MFVILIAIWVIWGQLELVALYCVELLKIFCKVSFIPSPCDAICAVQRARKTPNYRQTQQ